MKIITEELKELLGKDPLEILELADVDPPADCLDWADGLTVQSGEEDGVEYVPAEDDESSVLYITVGVRPLKPLVGNCWTLREDLDADDVLLGIMRAQEWLPRG